MSGSAPRIDKLDTNSLFASLLATQQGVTSLVAAPLVSVPSTAIQNRAQIPNMAVDVGTRMGVNRVHMNRVYPIASEYGASGERVFGVAGDEISRVRLVGPNWITQNDSGGHYIRTDNVGDYIEVTFYGTGFGLLIRFDSSAIDIRVSVDGGVEGGNAAPSMGSTLIGRNYNPNIPISLANNLTLGIHTVKVRLANAHNMDLSGFEIYNEGTSLVINQGTVYGNSTISTIALQVNTPYNSSFESGTLGARGGRVLVYAKSDGAIGKAVTPTDVASATLASAGHANEDPIRVFIPMEFGQGRSANDDWSAVTTSSNHKGFNLDDATHNLLAWTSASSSGYINNDVSPRTWSAAFGAVGVSATGFLTFTFVGTGLDLLIYDTANGGNDQFTFQIDGGAPVNWPYTAGNTSMRLQKVVSGLPFGTHTFRINKPTTANTFLVYISQFIVYGPKKPTLPSGAVEISEYFINATYVANATAGLETIATGVVRKHFTREVTTIGSWAFETIDPSIYVGGWRVDTTTNGSSIEYTFYGTGFEARGRGLSNTTVPVSLQSLTTGGALLSLTSANFPGLTTSGYGAYSFTYATGNFASSGAGPNAPGSGITVSGLALGLYKVRFTNGTSSNFGIEAFDVITPLYAIKEPPVITQNAAVVGSQGISELRRFSTIAYPNKTLAYALNWQGPSTNSSSHVGLPGCATVFKSKTGRIRVTFQSNGRNTSANQNGRFQIMVDGLKASAEFLINDNSGATESAAITIHRTLEVTPGYHFIQATWYTTGGSEQALESEMTVEDV